MPIKIKLNRTTINNLQSTINNQQNDINIEKRHNKNNCI